MAARQHALSKRITIESIKQLRQNTQEGSTLEVIFNTQGLLTYKTAQNLAFFPENSKEDVNAILKHLKVEDPQKMFIFEENSDKKGIKHPFKTPCSIL